MTTDDRLTRSLKTLAIIALSLLLAMAVIAFLHRIVAVVIVVGGAVFFAYLIYPVVSRFARRMPRWLAILCVYLLLVLVIGSIIAFIGPKLGDEGRAFAVDFPNIARRAQDLLLGANTTVLSAIPIEARETAVAMFAEAGAALQKEAVTLAGQALGFVLSIASIVTAFVIIPVLAFYILLDADRLRSGVIGLVPAAQRATVLAVLHDVDTVLGGFIRGQIIVGASVAVLVTIVLLALQIKYALLIGVFAGVVDIIPYLGAVAGAIPAVLIALLTHGFGWGLLVVAAFVLINQAEGHIIAPNVVGHRVGLTPLMVVVAILIGAELGGILGMFVAVPIAGVIKAIGGRFLPKALSELAQTSDDVRSASQAVEKDDPSGR